MRAADGRVKQYETEIGQLKAANETLGLDVSRKTDENIVCIRRNAILRSKLHEPTDFSLRYFIHLGFKNYKW